MNLDNYHKKLKFIEKITSNVTHEINNVFSIINEYSGMLEDKLILAQETGELDLEKLITCKEKIVNQLSRGKNQNKLLNEFSHSVMLESQSYNLHSTLVNFLALINRIIKNHEMELRYSSFSEDIITEFNLLDFQMELFSIIDLLISSSVPHTYLDIRIIPHNEDNIILELKSEFKESDSKNKIIEMIDAINKENNSKILFSFSQTGQFNIVKIIFKNKGV